ncbi:phosphatidylserine synthase [Arthrobacter sp. B3I4]|nr:phosphatidylserine synthase [Arthrobacter sp. B3I4]
MERFEKRWGSPVFVVFSPGLFLLPIIPLVRLAYPEYRARTLQTVVEILLGVAVVVVAFALPTPEGWWSSLWIYAGGASTEGLVIAFWARGLPRHSRRRQLSDGVIAWLRLGPNQRMPLSGAPPS